MSDGLGGSPLGVSALEEITKLTGGETYYGLSDSTILAEKFCREIAQGLRNQYTLGYVPKEARKEPRMAISPILAPGKRERYQT
jgi:hypothetical protein